MKFTEPSDWTVACSYEQTLLGSLLAMNPCPKDAEGPYEFFFDALDSNPQSIHTANMYIWQVSEVTVNLKTSYEWNRAHMVKPFKWQCILCNPLR